MTFFASYNNEHRHSGIAYMTPQSMHSGHAPQLFVARQGVLDHAWSCTLSDFRGVDRSRQKLPTHAGINWPKPPPAATGTTPI